jgi:hypothetical protein
MLGRNGRPGRPLALVVMWIIQWRYITDQGSPYPLVTLNPFGRELLLSDVSTGFKRSTWIERTLDYGHVHGHRP